jgi:AcrR family transcriptional regulator
MPIPVSPVLEEAWSRLSHDEKRARALATADALFTREGIDVPMPEVAKAVGVGVGSLYRQVGMKEDLVAALVLQRAEAMRQRCVDAAGEPDTWAALREVVFATIAQCIGDRIAQEAWSLSLERGDVSAARGAVIEALETLVAAARAQEVIRPDATATDLRLLFRSVREAESLEAGGARRLAELTLAGLQRHRV